MNNEKSASRHRLHTTTCVTNTTNNRCMKNKRRDDSQNNNNSGNTCRQSDADKNFFLKHSQSDRFLILSFRLVNFRSFCIMALSRFPTLHRHIRVTYVYVMTSCIGVMLAASRRLYANTTGKYSKSKTKAKRKRN